uniref:Dehydrogenase/reductase (SDR family) X-linked n=1 Tax=Cyprinodon variegatus TaxID=28743 RepID=A0A3Q2EFK0_CYPVA
MGLLSGLVPLLRLYLCGIRVLLYQMFHRTFEMPELPRQDGRVAIVTGGTRGMGFETARQLAALGMHVIIGRHDDLVLKVKAEFVFVDLTSLASVRHFVQMFRSRSLPLDVLVNNAGVMLVPETRTHEGFEFHFCLNFLSHFLLTNLLLDLLQKSGRPGRCSRIINMSSATHYGADIHLDDLNKRTNYSSHAAYSQSKLALVLFTYHLQKRLEAEGHAVTVNAVDPGMVDTALYDNLWTLASSSGRFLHERWTRTFRFCLGGEPRWAELHLPADGFQKEAPLKNRTAALMGSVPLNPEPPH